MILQATDENIDIKVLDNNVYTVDKNLDANVEISLSDNKHYLQLVIYSKIGDPEFDVTFDDNLKVRHINYVKTTGDCVNEDYKQIKR